MFEGFNEPARQVIVLAQDSARHLGHDYIGTEHLLLGLLRNEEGLAARALLMLGLTEARVRADVIRIVGGSEDYTEGQIPFTPRAKTALEHSLREQLALHDPAIGTEHVLLALLRADNRGVAVGIIEDAGFDTVAIRNEVLRVRGDQPMRHGRIDRSVLPAEWLIAISPLLSVLGSEIRRTFGRDPDTGDLLVALAAIPGHPAAEALRSLDVESDALAVAARNAHLVDVGQTCDEAEQLRELRRLLGLPAPG
jgi:ATP-dependent Clp protease ATP-binding subunit ClpA